MEQTPSGGNASRGAAVVLGAGPGLGMSIAHRFARAGHPVAVVSRTDARHPDYLRSLADADVPAIAEVADVLDSAQVSAVLDRIVARLGPVEVLYFGPAAMEPQNLPVPIDRLTGAAVRDGLAIVPPAADAVAAVLPGMLDRGTGAILLPTGLSAVRPMPELGNLALAGAALRTYALTLNAAVADRGVYVGSLVIGGGILRGDIYRAMVENRLQELGATGLDPEQLARMSLDPDELAETAYQLTVSRDRAEAVFSVLD
ncbi:SDR family NAD(P)-dependent oxidoreductase [Microlunatus soli]|uniref:SDR family NAD(P)-dependent oxidoreductase n=1 Tax=Microlunatus soli TaxID=630515 RepID=UPI0018D2891A|nr:SDR family NAD(P)-dependent oxidoreductase [Microlunatus soli]